MHPYYESKEQFFYLMCKHDFARSIAKLDSDEYDTALDQLRAFIIEWILQLHETSIYFTQHWFTRIIDTDYHESAGFAAEDPGKAYLDPIKRCLIRAVANSELNAETPVDDIAEFITMSLYGSSARDVLTKRGRNLIEWGEVLSHFIIDNCLAPYRVTK